MHWGRATCYRGTRGVATTRGEDAVCAEMVEPEGSGALSRGRNGEGAGVRPEPSAGGAQQRAHREAVELVRRAEAQVSAGKEKEALSMLRRAAETFAGSGELLQAIAAAKQILRLQPGHRETQTLLADLFARRHGGLAGDERDRTAGSGPEAEGPDHEGLPAIPLFSSLSRNAFIMLLEHMVLLPMKAGEAVISEGDEARSFFVISSGEVAVLKEGGDGSRSELGRLGAGQFFGEIAFFARSTRTATVECTRDSEIFEIQWKDLAVIARKYPSVERVLRSFYRERLVSNLTSTSRFFNRVPEERRHELFQRFRPYPAAEGEVIVEEGRPNANFHVIVSGEVEVTKKVNGSAKTLTALGTGDFFGEISLLFDAPATATVRATRESVLLRISRVEFHQTIQGDAATIRYLRQVAAERKAELEEIEERAAALGAEGAGGEGRAAAAEVVAEASGADSTDPQTGSLPTRAREDLGGSQADGPRTDSGGARPPAGERPASGEEADRLRVITDLSKGTIAGRRATGAVNSPPLASQVALAEVLDADVGKLADALAAPRVLDDRRSIRSTMELFEADLELPAYGTALRYPFTGAGLLQMLVYPLVALGLGMAFRLIGPLGATCGVLIGLVPMLAFLLGVVQSTANGYQKPPPILDQIGAPYARVLVPVFRLATATLLLWLPIAVYSLSGGVAVKLIGTKTPLWQAQEAFRAVIGARPVVFLLWMTVIGAIAPMATMLAAVSESVSEVVNPVRVVKLALLILGTYAGMAAAGAALNAVLALLIIGAV